MPGQMPVVYEGDRPYIFACYAYADREVVLPIIRALVKGYRVWYDDGTQAGSSFPDYIANRLHDCSCVLMLVSRSSLGSGWCRNEVGYALDLGRPVLPVYLEDVELPRALQMRLGLAQALHWHAYATDDDFNEELFSVRMLDPCLTSDAKRTRGVPLERMESIAGLRRVDSLSSTEPSRTWDKAESLRPVVARPGTKRESNQKPRTAVSSVDSRQILLDAFPMLRELFRGGQSVDVPGVNQKEAFGDYSLIELKRYTKPS